MRTYFSILTIAVLALAVADTAFGDVTIKAKQTTAGQSYENTTYIKGKRSRSESMNGAMINITQCDLRRGVQLNPAAKTYLINAFAAASKPGSANTVHLGDGVVTVGGTITTTITIKDTGERKSMFGFTARHLISTMENVSSPDACTPNNTRMQTDGWYIDAEFALDCDLGYQRYSAGGGKGGGCRDRYEVKTVGTAKRGYPVYEKMTMFDGSGKEIMSMVNEVTELSRTTLEATLFELPADYREVSDAAALYTGFGAGNGTGRAHESNSGASGQISAAARVSSTDASAVGPKRPGVIRIGVVGVKTGAVGSNITAGELALATRNTFRSHLKMTNIEAVEIEAKLASGIDAESREKECDYIVFLTASHKKGGGGFSSFGSAIASGIGAVGIGHTGSTAGNIAGHVATQAIVTAGTFSANVRSKDEITLEVALVRPGGASVLAQAFKQKAKANGEDVLTGVVGQAAQAVIAAIGG